MCVLDWKCLVKWQIFILAEEDNRIMFNQQTYNDSSEKTNFTQYLLMLSGLFFVSAYKMTSRPTSLLGIRTIKPNFLLLCWIWWVSKACTRDCHWQSKKTGGKKFRSGTKNQIARSAIKDNWFLRKGLQCQKSIKPFTTLLFTGKTISQVVVT